MTDIANNPNIYKIISDISLTGLLGLFFLVLIIYRKTIQDFFRCKKKIDKLLVDIEKLNNKLNDKLLLSANHLEQDKENLEQLKNEIEYILHKNINDLKMIIAELKLKASEDNGKIIYIETYLKDIEKTVSKLLKIIKKYLNIEDFD